MTQRPVYEMALQLQDRARQLSEGAAGEKEAARVASRISELTARLAELRREVTVALALKDQGAAVVASLPAASDGLEPFTRRAENGWPGDQAFNTAKRKVQEAATAIREENLAAWAEWSGRRLAALPLARIPMLPPQEQASARSRRVDLERAASAKTVTTGDITLFVTKWESLAESLRDAKEPPVELLALLERLDSRPAPTLRDITDQEIALLREFAMDGQVSLTRKGA
ncbi:hypothetical protein J7I94_09670 [Streptomyces sp. ISL-12]|uniref:hypothetical protein n=1 Tax=Streptomyces sp. ISL-12 TaxID=2819177 RepID=UPI001BE85937|nr:hypothetical protein [Streptomyces sp. ISL-12]MBT2410826.1 hypothetical protein [Streptomyces sp. ISL-12]